MIGPYHCYQRLTPNGNSRSFRFVLSYWKSCHPQPDSVWKVCAVCMRCMLEYLVAVIFSCGTMASAVVWLSRACVKGYSIAVFMNISGGNYMEMNSTFCTLFYLKVSAIVEALSEVGKHFMAYIMTMIFFFKRFIYRRSALNIL